MKKPPPPCFSLLKIPSWLMRCWVCLILPLCPLVLSGAELVVDYDLSAPGAWKDGRLEDSMGNAPTQIPPSAVTQEEYARISQIEGFDPSVSGPDDFGPPEFVQGKGPGGRSYLSFEKVGALTLDEAANADRKFECRSGAFLNTDGDARGYTMEMLVRIQPDYRSTSQLAIGPGGETSLQNVLLGLRGRSAKAVTAVGPLDGSAVTPENYRNFQVVTNLPFEGIAGGFWAHLTKVHDPAAKSMTYYLDGQLIEKTDLSTLPELGSYPPRDDFLNLLGAQTRRMSGVDLSFFRAYRGPMTAAEVQKLYEASRKAP